MTLGTNPMNTADLATKLTDLKNVDQWLKGAEFLIQDPPQWSNCVDLGLTQAEIHHYSPSTP